MASSLDMLLQNINQETLTICTPASARQNKLRTVSLTVAPELCERNGNAGYKADSAQKLKGRVHPKPGSFGPKLYTSVQAPAASDDVEARFVIVF
jgi:hypothetical protein